MCIWTTLATSNTMSIFVISLFELGSIPILRVIYEVPIFGHLCHFLCHCDQFGDKIFKNQAHIRNQAKFGLNILSVSARFA